MGRRIGRFDIVEESASGSAGTIFRAIDPDSGAHVAVKALRGMEEVDAARFVREARILSRVRHPGVVRYVDHGRADGGSAYLVMEWIDGEDLRHRLARAGLTLNESVALGKRVAEALAVVHAHGLVHRDIKPGNLFLPGGRVEDAKIIDFGLVRGEMAGGVDLTQTGLVVGTPSYMAPEQARGQREIDARADLFSLGAVLFKCLTGRAPFEGRSIMAVLTKVLLDEAPRVRSLRGDVPAALDDLVARLLAKDPAARPASAAEVAAALAALGNLGDDGEEIEPAPPSSMVSGLGGDELRVMSILLVGGDLPAPSRSGTRPVGEIDDEDARLARIADGYGAKLDRLMDGTRVVTLLGAGLPTDQTARAARCALSLAAALPGAPMALATGRGEVARRKPVGEAIDRAAALLAQRLSAKRAEIAVDDVTAALLGPRFDVEVIPGGLTLRGLRAADAGLRTLLGQATPMVGRAWELGSIETLFHECADEPEVRAALVTGGAGMGKSRLAREVVRAIKRRSPSVRVWTASGDPLRSGSSLALLGQIVRSAAEMVEASDPAERRASLVAGIAALVPAGDAARVADFLGEIADAPAAAGGEGVALRAARQDARIMSREVAAAWTALLDAAGAAGPVVIALEDLHWAAAASVRLLGAAAADLAGRPILILAMARPEIHDTFPQLFEGLPAQEIRLAPLGRRASEQLVHAVLGKLAGAALTARIAVQAEGNAFYLEELIRAAAEGSGAGDVSLPATVLAMVQARLEGLDADTRRVLRAASVFGEVFWPGAVAALLGGSMPRAAGVDALVAQELAVARPASRFPGERELAFRHALLREGAYAMLTRADRVLGHRLAAEWLEAHGETDAMLLARHYEMAEDTNRAGELYLAAAASALRSGDPAVAIARAERARAAGLPPARRADVLAVLSFAHAWNDDWDRAGAIAADLAGAADRGSARWFEAMALKQTAAAILGRPAELLNTLAAMMNAAPAPGAVQSLAQGLALGVLMLSLASQFSIAAVVRDRLELIAGPFTAGDPVTRGWVQLGRTYIAAFRDGDVNTGIEHARASRASFREARDVRHAWFAQAFVAMCAWCLGQFEDAERDLRELPIADGDHLLAAIHDMYLAGVLLAQGRPAEVVTVAERRIAAARARGAENPLREAQGRWLLGDAARSLGDLDTAGRELSASLQPLRGNTLQWQLAVVALAAVRLAEGRAEEALSLAREAYDVLTAQGSPGLRGTLVRITFAEALAAVGRNAEARARLAEVIADLRARAAAIADPAARATFLTRVPENARAIDLAAAWLGERL